MSNNHGDSSRNVAYDPLPLTADDQPSNALYNAPPSPDPRLSSYHTPQSMPEPLPGDETPMIPPGAAQPRFLGAALYDGPQGSPGFRDSFASSQHTFPHSEYNSSVHALNDPAGYRDDPRDSYYVPEHGGFSRGGPASSATRVMEEKRAAYAPPKAKSRRRVMILAALVALILILLAVFIPLYFTVIRKSSNETASNNSPTKTGSAGSTGTATSSNAAPSASAKPVTGGFGSLIELDDGTTMTYQNNFGGQWYWDPNDPFNNGARAQSWSPALNESFQYGTQRIYG